MADHPLPDGRGKSAFIPFNALSVPPPCAIPANELQPMVFSQMQLDTHHLGMRTVIYVVGPTIRNSEAIIAEVEDQEGSRAGVRLRSTWLPLEEVVPAQQALRPDSWYLIKQPLALEGPDTRTHILLVEHPGDICLLPSDHEFIPAESRKSDVWLGKSGQARLKGNEAVGKKNWAESEELYSIAIRTARTDEETRLAYLNRSLANLRLGRPATALADAIKSNGADIAAPTEKGLFREASALYDLAKYDQSLDRLQTLKTAFPTNTSAIPLIDRVQERIKEQKTGHYDFGRMYQQAKATPPLIDCATYTMPVEIRDSPGKGRGVFTKSKVLAGELLICEKAFGYIYAGTPGRQNINLIDVKKEMGAQVVQKLFHSIEDARMFVELAHGDHAVVPVDEVDGKPVIDSFLVRKVLNVTSSFAPRTSLSFMGEEKSGNSMGVDSTSSTAGVWAFISHINHSCISNIRCASIGDVQIIRATRDLEAGAELFSSYMAPMAFESYDENQKQLKGWGFTCDCTLCSERRTTPNEVSLKRKSLQMQFNQFIGSRALNKAQHLLDQLEGTYSDAAKQPGAVRLEVCFCCVILLEFMMLLPKGVKHAESIVEVALKGLEAFGFVISTKPQLRVIQWGLAQDYYPIDAFRDLYLAYKTTAPQNAQAAKRYMEIAYSFFMGEKETMLQTYPEVA